jgi:hypothetical protein
MSKARALAYDLVTRPLSPEEIKRRREAERPHTQQVGTTSGQLVDLVPATTQAPPRAPWQAEEQPID